MFFLKFISGFIASLQQAIDMVVVFNLFLVHLLDMF